MCLPVDSAVVMIDFISNGNSSHQRLVDILIYYTQHSIKKTLTTRPKLKPKQWSPRRRRSNHQRLVAILIYYTQHSNKKTVRTRLRLKPRQWSPRPRRSNHQRLVAILIYYTQHSNKKTVRTRLRLKTGTVITKTETQQPSATTCHTDLLHTTQ